MPDLGEGINLNSYIFTILNIVDFSPEIADWSSYPEIGDANFKVCIMNY